MTTQSEPKITIIAALAKNNGIGFNGQIPWKCPEDMKWFKEITSHTEMENGMNVIIMGRKTWDSLGRRPLPKRWNIVLTRQKDHSTLFTNPSGLGRDMYGVYRTTSGTPVLSFNSDLQTTIRMVVDYYAFNIGMVENIFIIGGEEIYRQSIYLCHRMFITHLKKKYDADTFFPTIQASQFRMARLIRSHTDFDIIEYQKLFGGSSIDGETQYLQILNQILDNGNVRLDRTGVGTQSVFGQQIRIPLGGQIPLLTTKRTYWKGIVEELLWLLRGSTNVKELQDRGVHIWDGNSTREFLDSVGLTNRKVGDIGPTYGFNFRHFGAEYRDCGTDYRGSGVDQVAEAIRLIREEPWSRRIIITLWNPTVLQEMALPPCLYNYQFYVCNGKLSCCTYQRSGDMGLGVPFNLASASLLTYILATITGLEAWELIHNIGDAHIYNNHVAALKEQVGRVPKPFPLLWINPEKTYRQVEDFQYSDFKLIGYYPDPAIKMDMAV